MIKRLLRPIKHRLVLARKRLVHRLSPLFGWDLPMETEDRFWLEQRIFPYLLARPEYRRILFVGIAYYTKHYERLLPGVEFWTMDPDRERRPFGAVRHATDILQHLDRYVPAGFFDAIIVNGVIGWGLNEPAEIEKAYAICHQGLRQDGLLVVGWCDMPHLRCLPPHESESLKAFAPYPCSAIGGSVMQTDTPNRHTYSFFRKPGG